jgi:hypothetical protein
MLKVEHFNIRIVNMGDRYGLDDCLTNTKGPMIEFYDSRYAHTPRGQFVSRYYLSTLLEREPAGLCLDGGVPAWTVSAEGMKKIMEYIQA